MRALVTLTRSSRYPLPRGEGAPLCPAAAGHPAGARPPPRRCWPPPAAADSPPVAAGPPPATAGPMPRPLALGDRPPGGLLHRPAASGMSVASIFGDG